MEFARDFAVELFEPVGVKTILAAADLVIRERDRVIAVELKSLRFGDLLFDPGQFVVALADGAEVARLEGAQAGLQVRKLRLAFDEFAFEFDELFATLPQRLLFAQLI